MLEQLKWSSTEKKVSILEWTHELHVEAKRLFAQDGSHGNMMFSFNEENGLISVNLIPANTDEEQVNDAIINTVNEHNLYAVVLIGEAWVYFAKKNDHTVFQLLDGEMKVSDLNDDDKKEALMIRMEYRDGDSIVFLDEIVRDENGPSLKEGRQIIQSPSKKWF